MNNLINTAGIAFAFIEYQGGSQYEPELRYSKCYKQGIRIFNNGVKYEGEFLNGELNGQGILTFANGNIYRGGFLNGERVGKGIYTWLSGNKYEGEFFDGEPNGQGTIVLVNGDIYKGEFLNGKRTGQGIYTWVNGKKYEGEFLDGKLNGQGIFTWANGSKYEGEFLDGQQKKGTFISCGLIFTCEFQNDHPVSDISHISDPLFLGMLTQKAEARADTAYSLGVIADYLLKNHYETQGNALEQARKNYFAIASSPDALLIESEKIHSTLQTLGHMVLLSLQSLDHSMGLQMVQKVEGFVDFEIYNSGGGLSQYHDEHPFKANTFRTGWRKRVPLGVLTLDKLQPFLKEFTNTHEAYEAIINLSGSEGIGSDSDTTVWQKEQKQYNCSLMWIFAYLRNNMDAGEYTAMRHQLFQDCLLAVENSASPDQEMLGHLEKKVAKLEKKMKAYKEIAFNVEARVSKVGMLYISC